MPFQLSKGLIIWKRAPRKRAGSFAKIEFTSVFICETSCLGKRAYLPALYSSAHFRKGGKCRCKMARHHRGGSKAMLFLNISKMFSLWLALAFQLNGLIYCYSLYRKSLNDKLVSYYRLKRTLVLKKLKAVKMRRLSQKSRSVWVKQGRSDMWWVNLISRVSPEELWKKNFRMNKAEFLELCAELRPYVSPKGNSPNYRSLTLEKKVAVALYFLKDTGSLWMTGNTFGIHQSTISKVLVEVCTLQAFLFIKCASCM